MQKDSIEYDDVAWQKLDVCDLWVYDKLILSKTLGHVCGPAGVNLPRPGIWVVKPITNILGMGLGARYQMFDTVETSLLEPGMFWMEMFDGVHLSVDLNRGVTEVVYEGTRESPDRFSKWTLRNMEIDHPQFITDLSIKYGRVNYEMIGGKIIEVHVRGNPDWLKYRAKELIPVWKDSIIPDKNFILDEDGDRLGFIIDDYNNYGDFD